jgi:23S rRNA (guanosine2251-2'-O)-methyltransferase
MKKLSHQKIQSSKPSIKAVKRMKRKPIYALLDNVRSLHNVGAIFRTSDAVLLEKLYLCGITGAPPRKEITKTALGAEEVVPFEYFDEASSAIEELKKAGVTIVAVELSEKSKGYDELEYDFPVCFVFGHEVEGISNEVMKSCDLSIDLPMLGRANSLNVATCFGIVVYEALKQLK